MIGSRWGTLDSSSKDNRKVSAGNGENRSAGPMKTVRRSTRIDHVAAGTSQSTMDKISQSKVSQSCVSNEDKDLTFITSKSQTGDPYAALLNLDDSLEDDLLITATYTRSVVKFSGTPPVKGKPSKFDSSKSSHKLFLLPGESFDLTKICGKSIGQGATVCTIKGCKI